MGDLHFELHLPKYLDDSLKSFIEGKKKAASDKSYLHFDCDYCLLQANINCAETDNDISTEQAWYLREKYLGISK